LIYPKNKQANLTDEEKKMLKELTRLRSTSFDGQADMPLKKDKKRTEKNRFFKDLKSRILNQGLKMFLLIRKASDHFVLKTSKF
jgi:hypothetical protein